jgi:hypothetical protein
MKIRFQILAVVAVLAGGVVILCLARPATNATTPIANIVASPQIFDGHRVFVLGEVVELRRAFAGDEMTYGLVDDTRAVIEVVVDTPPLPPVGAQVRIAGIVRRRSALGLFEFAPIILERQRTTRGATPGNAESRGGK